MAHVCGLGYLLDPKHVRATLRAIVKHNRRSGFHGHFNNMRSYVLGDEAALLMGTYPRGRRPKQPFPYATEVMTGFEYAAAIGMLYEGQTAAGLKCIADIRARYDGLKRSPFDEAECGHHYARAMASWAAVLALTGFHYSGVTQTMTIRGDRQASQGFLVEWLCLGHVRPAAVEGRRGGRAGGVVRDASPAPAGAGGGGRGRVEAGPVDRRGEDRAVGGQTVTQNR